MHRFCCCSLEPSQKQVRIDDPVEVHHIVRVLRLHPGDEVELINGRGALARGRLLGSSKSVVEVEVLAYDEKPRANMPRVILACAIPKKSKFDDILEKSTELGVDEVVPIVTDRTEVSPSKEAVGRMEARFNNVIVSASKQCKRLWFPTVHPVMRFEAAVDMLVKDGNALFIPWLEGERAPLKEALSEVRSQKSDAKGQRSAVVFFIGPEGDFTSVEAAYAKSHGAVPVSLGDTVLRVDTAAIAVVAYAHFALCHPEPWAKPACRQAGIPS
jgi:16S rRNA (uracil1498-N3)-methyltransferase